MTQQRWRFNAYQFDRERNGLVMAHVRRRAGRVGRENENGANGMKFERVERVARVERVERGREREGEAEEGVYLGQEQAGISD